jgi:hypothetical protein
MWSAMFVSIERRLLFAALAAAVCWGLAAWAMSA